MHRATYHFIKSLHISLFTKTKRTAAEDENDDQPEDSDDDINMSTNIEALSGDVAAMVSTAMTNFEPGDVLGKLLAFVNQVRMSSKGVCAYLNHVCAVHHLKPIKLHLWVQTRWESMSHCLELTLAIEKVSSYVNLY